MTEAKREHREAAVFAMGIEGWSLDGVAAAIAEAEQRGAEREREAFTELFAAADAMINGFVVPGQSREQTERQLMARLTAARSKLPYFCAKAESSQYLKGEE